MEQYALYLVLKKILNEISEVFRVSFNDMDFNKGNVCGIYIKAGEPSEYRLLGSGDYLNHSARVQFLFQGSLNNQTLFTMLDAASKLRETLCRSCNRTIVAPPNIRWVDGELAVVNDDVPVEEGEEVTVTISLIALLGEVDFKGKSEQGIPRYSLNFKIYYSIGGK